MTTKQQELDELARKIIDANAYMTLGTADKAGRPWVSPVWFASERYREFYWVSSPESTHSQNLAVRPDLSIVIFNSHAPINTGQAVYLSAVARELTGEELEQGIAVFSRALIAAGEREWSQEDVMPPACLRLYVAVVEQHWVLDPYVEGDRRIAVTP